MTVHIFRFVSQLAMNTTYMYEFRCCIAGLLISIMEEYKQYLPATSTERQLVCNRVTLQCIRVMLLWFVFNGRY